MDSTIRLAFLIVSIVLFALAAIPTLPYSANLVAAGLAFFAASHV
jgi:hypothetical protein